jgi:hypothetical protein
MTVEKQDSSTGPRPDSRSKLILAAMLAASYLITGFLFLTPTISNADAVSYISIAQKYARGDLANAVNGYWSPLLSWLLVPPILLSVNPVLAVKGLLLICGLALSFGIFLLGKRFGLSPEIGIFLAALALPIILFRYALGSITPDLLVAAILVYYFYLVFDPECFQSAATWPLCGLLAAGAYFAKSYAFFFILAHCIALGVSQAFLAPRGPHRMRVVRKAVGIMVVFLAVSGAWVTALSLKYHRLTISTSGRIAMGLHSPDSRGQFTKSSRIIRPPNPSAVSAWEDPSFYASQSSPPTPEPAKESNHFVAELKSNSAEIASVLIRFSLLSLVILPSAFILSFRPKRHRPVLLALASLLIYSSGYAVVGVNTRYLYIIEVLILLLGGYMLNLLFQRMGPGKRGPKACLALVFTALFMLTPYTLSAKFPQEHPALFKGRHGGWERALYVTGRSLAQALATYDRDASSGRRVLVASDKNYQDTLIVSYYAKLGYCGLIAPKKKETATEKDLVENGVDYLFLWNLPKSKYPFLKDCHRLRLKRRARLRIFDIRRLRNGVPGR